MVKKTEILAPVGNKEMLVSAVRSGADAVYFGAKDFSARRNAENFDNDELKEAIEYCKIRGVKTYLTLNILIKDGELTEAFNLAKTAYNLGIDAVIIEDLGLAALLKREIPELSLHASTQMSVHTPSALKILKKLGFSRVVAAREMSFSDLKAFCEEAKKQGVEVEVFVHGALCMAVSGQCQLSAFLGSRSGNRGLCAGPCRLPFAAENGTGYDLSLKDLSLLSHIKKLEEIGVISFKIEGRMKRPEYVSAATKAAKFALLNGYIDQELESTLKSVFSRSGFTDGYFTDKLGREMFGIRTKEDVISSNDAFSKIHEFYRAENQSVEISVSLEAKAGRPLKLTLSDGENTVCITADEPQKAENKPATEELLRKNLDKFGSTPYKAREIKIDLDDGLFISAATVNELRRNASESLNKKRSEGKREESKAKYSLKKKKRKESKPKLYIRVENEAQIPNELEGIDTLIFPLEERLQEIPENVNIALDIPRGIKDEKIIRSRLAEYKLRGITSAFCGNLSAMEIAIEEGFTVFADTALNIFNTESAAVFSALGAEKLTLSNEMLLSDAVSLYSEKEKGVIAYGNIPLMLFKNCPIKNGKNCASCDKKGVLTDRLGTRFPVRCRLGFSEMLNSVPIWAADRIAEFSGLDFITLYFSDESPERVKEVITAYKKGLSPDCDYTRGLLFRGTL